MLLLMLLLLLLLMALLLLLLLLLFPVPLMAFLTVFCEAVGCFDLGDGRETGDGGLPCCRNRGPLLQPTQRRLAVATAAGVVTLFHCPVEMRALRAAAKASRPHFGYDLGARVEGFKV